MGRYGLNASGLRQGPVMGPCEHSNEPLSSLRDREFLIRWFGLGLGLVSWLVKSVHWLVGGLGIRKNFHSIGRNLLLYLFIKRMMKLNVVSLEGYHCYQTYTKFYPIFFSHCWSFNVDFNITDKLLIRCSAFVRYWRKNGRVIGQYTNYLWILRMPVTQESSIVQYSH